MIEHLNVRPTLQLHTLERRDQLSGRLKIQTVPSAIRQSIRPTMPNPWKSLIRVSKVPKSISSHVPKKLLPSTYTLALEMPVCAQACQLCGPQVGQVIPGDIGFKGAAVKRQRHGEFVVNQCVALFQFGLWVARRVVPAFVAEQGAVVDEFAQEHIDDFGDSCDERVVLGWLTSWWIIWRVSRVMRCWVLDWPLSNRTPAPR